MAKFEMTGQAIVVKYIGPTDARGSSVKASCQAGSVTLDWNDALNANSNHAAAVEALVTKLAWDGDWYGGGSPDGQMSCWVRVS